MLTEKIEYARKFAENAHFGQTRSDGSPYINHPIRVSEIVSFHKDSHRLEDLICASLLHDTIEDTSTTYSTIFDKFGQLIASLVDELTSDKTKIALMGKTEYLSDKMVGMSSWGLVIKLSDRLDNVSDLKTAKSEKWRNKYRAETESILSYVEENRKVLSGTHRQLISKIRKAILI